MSDDDLDNTVRLTPMEYQFLRSLASESAEVATLVGKATGAFGGWHLVVGEPTVVEAVRDLLTLKLATQGFGESYELNDEGRMIEDLIDKLYIS